MSEQEAIKLLNYKIINADTDIYIGDLDKTNIEAIKIVLSENKKQKELLDKIKKYIEENKLPEIYYDIESLKPILKHYIDADKILELLEEIE